ncbi:hypothetical protein ILUMI_26435, partial [Ignelater luminosus]
EYKIREGTINLGKEYEINILTLLSLQCLRRTTDDFWFASNADGVGAFDDIILHLGGQTFMLQLKQTAKKRLKLLTERQFVGSQKKEFHLKKYIRDICKLRASLNCVKTDKTNSDIIPHIGSFENVYFLLYTNKEIEPCDFLIPHNVSGSLAHLNSEKDSKIFQIDVKKVSFELGLSDVEDINNLYMFCNQIDPRCVPSKIEEEVRKITRSNCAKTVSEELIKYIIEWSKGNLGGYFYLTKRDIVSKLTELIFSNYEIKLLEKAYSFYENRQTFIWNKIIEDKIITVIDIHSEDNLIFDFLLKYIGNKVKETCNVTKRKRWFDSLPQKDQKLFYKDNPNLKWHIFKTAGSGDNIVLYHVYKCLWASQKLPLVLEIDKKEHYRQIVDILKLSNYVYKVIIINKSAESLTLDRKIHHFESLCDLNEEDREEILKQQIEFQGRPGATLKDLVDETMFTKIKSADIINILLGTYSVGMQLNIIPKYYIPRIFQNALSYEALKSISSCNDIFLIEDHNEFLKHFAVKENIELFYLMNNNLEDLNNCHIIVCNKPPNFENLKYGQNNIHHLVAQDINYLIWKQSYGNTFRETQYKSKYCTLSENNFSFGLTTVISAGPGMGKSMLMDSIAQQAPTDKWVIKINLRNHMGYYEEYKDIKKMKFLEHLNYFKGPLDSELENEIFQRLLRNRNIVILMDGFDEISISYKKQVTSIVKSFFQANFCVYLTTRPMERPYLEGELGVLGLELQSFNFDNQKQFLKEFYGENKESITNLEETLNTFIEKLLKEFEKNIKNKTTLKNDESDLLATPLHIRLLAEVFSDDCNEYLLNKGKADLTNIFDSVDLYSKFINKKDKILCDKFGFNDSYFLYKNYQYLFALRLLFPHLSHDINEYMDNSGKTERNYIKLLEKGGILTVDEKFNINFSHQTFAEYLAAEWLYRNLNNPNEKIKNIVRSAYEICVSMKFYGQSYPFLLHVLDHLLIGNGLHKVLYLFILNGQINEARKMINLNMVDLNATDRAKRTFFTFSLEKTVEIQADLFGYNPIDYAIRYSLFDAADIMCKKWPNAEINVEPDYPSKRSLRTLLSYPHLVESLISRYAYIDVILKKVKTRLAINSYIKNHIGDDIPPTTENVTISEVRTFKTYRKSNLCYEIVFESSNTVMDILQTSDKVNVRDANGYTLLHYAAFHGKLDVIDWLLSNDAVTNATDLYGVTPLHCSIIGGNFSAFCKLLCNASINTRDRSELTPLHYAVAYKRLRMIDMLLSKGADMNSESVFGATPLYTEGRRRRLVFSFSSTRCKILDLFVSRGFNINARNWSGETLLHHSTKWKNSKIVQKIVSYKADVNVQDYIGNTPLHEAIFNRNDNISVISLLLSNGADANIKNVEGLTPLHLGIMIDNYKVVHELLVYKADVNVQYKAGKTPLHMAIPEPLDGVVDSSFCGQAVYKVIEELVSHKADINIKNDAGYTPLHQAVLSNQRLDIVSLLLSNGANVNIKSDVEGETVLHFGVKCASCRIIQALLFYKADINEQNNEGDTPLHQAILKRQYSD